MKIFYSIVYLFVASVLLLSCDSKTQEKTPLEKEGSAQMVLDLHKLPKMHRFNAEVEKKLVNWNEFKEFEDSFSTLYQVKDVENLKVVLNDLIQKEIALHSNKFPEELKTPGIKSRIKVVKTFLFKTKNETTFPSTSRSTYRQNLEALVFAYNALKQQIEEVLFYKIKVDFEG